MRIAILSPIAWRTPPVHYGPWERVVSLLAEGLVAKGVDVTLFATGNSKTKGRLRSVCRTGYEEDHSINIKVWECLHISELFDNANDFDIIHNNFDFLPLTYTSNISTPVVTTIHGFSSPELLPVYKKYNGRVYYVSISNADRSPELEYINTIYHGIDIENFTFRHDSGDYLVYFGRIHHDKGTKEAIEIARLSGKKIIIAGIIQDQKYFDADIKPFIDGKEVVYVGVAEPGLRNELLGRACALIHPINFNEPFGLSVVESMACGSPVIAFNRGSMPELIRNGLNGFLVSGVDEAVQAVKKIESIDRLNCRKDVEKRFASERMVDDYHALYKNILEKEKREDHRPWGYYQILADEPCHKVKRIHVYPGKRLSLQRHNRRSEHWHIIEGEGIATIDDKSITCKTGQSVEVSRSTLHRIENNGNSTLVFIEVQSGDYFGEDDIERVEDDYGRT